MKHTTEYLYGVPVTSFSALPYKEALEFKLKAGKILFDKLYLEVPYHSQDDIRISAIYKAMKHTRGLLSEIIPNYIA